MIKIRQIFFILSILIPGLNLFAASVNVNVEYLTYTVDTDTKTAEVYGLVNYTTTINNLVIPDYIDYEGEQIPVTSIKDDAFHAKNLTGSLTIGNNVQRIGKNAFMNCSRLNGMLTLGKSVQTIGNSAFRYCSRFTGSLIIGDSVQTIDEFAFYGCTGFTGSLTIGDSVQTIEESAFNGCSGFKGTLTLGNNVQSIGNNAFCQCSGFTGSLVIPNSVQTIGEFAFYNCTGFTGSLTIGDSVQAIEESTFHGCSGFKGTLTIGNNVNKICENAFFHCENITSVIFKGENLKTIEKWAFNNCKNIEGELIFPQSLETIDVEAFGFCNKITSLFIPNSVKIIGATEIDDKIGGGTFLGCSEIKKITCLALDPPINVGSNFALVVYDEAYLYVPSTSVSKYKTAADWKDFKYINPIPVEATDITLNKSALELQIGQEETLIATLTPEDAMSEVTWSVNEEGKFIISVNDNGKVTALSVGQATVTATAGDVSASCVVTVTPVLATSINIYGNGITTLKTTETLQLQATVLPENTTYPEVSWESSKPGVAQVTDDGLVSALTPGNVTITAYVTNQQEIKATYNLEIQEILLGDANDNGVVNVADVGTISDYIVQKPVAKFCFVNADVIPDKQITTADVTATIDIIFNDTPNMISRMRSSSYQLISYDNLIVDHVQTALNAPFEFGIRLDNSIEYVGIQGEIRIPEGLTVKRIETGKGAANHILNYNITDAGDLIFILYSLNNSPLATVDHCILKLQVIADERCEDIEIHNILASDANAQQYSLSSSDGNNNGDYSGVEEIGSSEIKIFSQPGGITVINATGEPVNIYSIDGKRIVNSVASKDKEVYATAPGIYIVKVRDVNVKLVVK